MSKTLKEIDWAKLDLTAGDRVKYHDRYGDRALPARKKAVADRDRRLLRKERFPRFAALRLFVSPPFVPEDLSLFVAEAPLGLDVE